MLTRNIFITRKIKFILFCSFICLCTFSCLHKLSKHKTVHDFNGFFKNPDSSCVIELMPGKYNISSMDTSSEGKFYRWSFYIEGNDYAWYKSMLTFRNLNNITLKGKGDKPEDTKIYSENTDAVILVFEKCKNVSIDNLWLGHMAATESCMGGVLCFIGCENVTINNTHMYGTGYYGFEVYNSKKFTCTNSDIFNCSGGVFGTYGCDTVRISNCTFYNNVSRGHFTYFSNCPSADLDSCIWCDNKIEDTAQEDQALFTLWNSNVVVRNSKINQNHLESMIHRYAADKFIMKNTAMKDNTIDGTYEAVDR